MKEKMETRRGHRRQRRNRLRYRQPRFLNRGSSKRSGRLPPSIRTNGEEVVRVVERIPLPIRMIVVEDVQVDIARLNTFQTDHVKIDEEPLAREISGG